MQEYINSCSVCGQVFKMHNRWSDTCPDCIAERELERRFAERGIHISKHSRTKLERSAAEATRRGMSYGKYMAMKKEVRE